MAITGLKGAHFAPKNYILPYILYIFDISSIFIIKVFLRAPEDNLILAKIGKNKHFFKCRNFFAPRDGKNFIVCMVYSIHGALKKSTLDGGHLRPF